MVKVKGQGRWKVDGELGGEVVGLVSELNPEPTTRLAFSSRTGAPALDHRVGRANWKAVG